DPVTCSIHGFIATFAAMTSLFLCLGITLFRYLVIVRHAKLKKMFPRYYLMAVVAIALLVTVPPFAMNRATTAYTLRPSHVYCVAAWYSKDYIVVVGGGACLCVTLLFMGYAYVAIFFKVREVLGSELTGAVLGRSFNTIKGSRNDINEDSKLHPSVQGESRIYESTNTLVGSSNNVIPNTTHQLNTVEKGAWKEHVKKQADEDNKY
ncbi:hypothetical protein HDU82_001360, partial [Entophlyctis luteolus]